MTPHECDPSYAAEIGRMKKRAIEKNRLDVRLFLATAVAGLVAGVIACFCALERDSTFGDMLGGFAVVGMLVSAIAYVILRVSTDHNRPAANCPRCSFGLGIAEYEDEWLKWNCCPGCGLKFNGDAEAEARPSVPEGILR